MGEKNYNNALDKYQKKKINILKFNRHCCVNDSIFDNDYLPLVLSFHMAPDSPIIQKQLSCISIYLC